jgi:hypothetical protein
MLKYLRIAVSLGDRDSFQCNCGCTLLHGKNVRFYAFKLIKLGEESEPREPS